MFSLVTLPSPSTFLTDVSSWSSPVFNDLLPVGELAIGFSLAGLVVFFLIRAVASSVSRLIGK